MNDISSMNITGEIRPVNVTSDIGIGYAVKSGATEAEYELLESITLEEDVYKIVRTTEPDGTALNLSHLYLKLTSPVYTESRRLYVSIGNTDSNNEWYKDRLLYGTDQNAINTDGTAMEVFCTRDHGLFTSYMIRSANPAAQQSMLSNISDVRTGAIKAIRIFAYGNTTNLIPAGTKIDIWGVRTGE